MIMSIYLAAWKINSCIGVYIVPTRNLQIFFSKLFVFREANLITWYLSILILGSSSLSFQVIDSGVESNAIIFGGRILLFGLTTSTPTMGSLLNSESSPIILNSVSNSKSLISSSWLETLSTGFTSADLLSPNPNFSRSFSSSSSGLNFSPIGVKKYSPTHGIARSPS